MAPHAVNHPLAEVGSNLAIRALTTILGIIGMIVGLSLGVSMVMLPLGIPIGLIGVLLFLWGLFGDHARVVGS